MNNDMKPVAQTKFEKKLVQDKYNTNVAFYVHINEFNNSVREEIDKKIAEIFYFMRGIDWNFDSYGVEKPGSRGNDIVCYFILRSADIEKLQKLFVDYFKDYNNAIKITCSVTKYEKIDEGFFELDI